MLRLREMRSALAKAKTQGVSMQRRLVLYWFSMALAILAAVLLVVSLTGVFSNTAQKFGQSLTIQKHNTASALAGQMDQLTAQSIALSEELTRELLAQGNHFAELSDSSINATELVAILIGQGKSLKEGIELVQRKVKGSCSMLVLTDRAIYAARDRFGRTDFSPFLAHPSHPKFSACTL